MGKKMNIMVVDDNRDLAVNLADILNEKGCKASAAFDGKGAIELARSEPFDLALLDYRLTDMDGLELQKRLAEIIDADYLIITAHASVESASKAVYRKRIVGYESKPLDMDRLLAFIRQIGERRKAEKIIGQQALHMRLAQDLAGIGYWSFDIADQKTVWSDMMYAVMGRPPAANAPSHFEHCEFIHPDDWLQYDRAFRKALEGEPYYIEPGIVHPDQSVHYIAIQGHPQRDAFGNITSLFGTARDITDRKIAEKKIQTALEEKETLLRELYHRTKNNMNVISSMIALQKGCIPDKETGIILRELEDKIRTMALVHERLYKSKNLSRIDLREYIRDLVDLLIKSHGRSPNAVAPSLEMESVPILIDTAIPCGLVLNELVSNGFKHAFSNEKQGKLRMKLSRSGEHIELLYSDNGPGVPDGFDFRAQKTLGLQTVFGIVEHQMRGTVEFDGTNGLSCRIRFKDSQYEERV